MAERAVQTCKKILKKSFDGKLDVLDLLAEYRATPIMSIGLSPSELLQGRLIRTKIPICNKKLLPLKVDSEIVKKRVSNYKNNYSRQFNQHTKNEVVFKRGDKVMIHQDDHWVPGIIEKS